MIRSTFLAKAKCGEFGRFRACSGRGDGLELTLLLLNGGRLDDWTHGASKTGHLNSQGNGQSDESLGENERVRISWAVPRRCKMTGKEAIARKLAPFSIGFRWPAPCR